MDWDHHFAEQKNSGLSVAAYCRQHKLNAAYWYRVRKQRRDSHSAERKFARVDIKESAPRKALSLNVEVDDAGQLSFNGTTNSPELFQVLLSRSLG